MKTIQVSVSMPDHLLASSKCFRTTPKSIQDIERRPKQEYGGAEEAGTSMQGGDEYASKERSST